MSRIQARELAFRLVFSLQFEAVSESCKEIEDSKCYFNFAESGLQINQSITDEYLQENSISNDDDRSFFYQLLNSYVANKSYIDEIITKNLASNKFKRVYKSDLAIINLAVAEILLKEYDYKIALNAAIELSKRYSDEKNYKFVHSVLSKIIKEICNG